VCTIYSEIWHGIVHLGSTVGPNFALIREGTGLVASRHENLVKIVVSCAVLCRTWMTVSTDQAEVGHSRIHYAR